jgi:hypothetical protein
MVHDCFLVKFVMNIKTPTERDILHAPIDLYIDQRQAVHARSQADAS